MPVRVEKQGKNECMLATMAALADVPLARVRKRACALAGVRQWRPYSMDRFWGVVAMVADELGIMGMVPTTVIFQWELSRPCGRPTLRGKGSILVVFPSNESHIMPYEDGLIYNPNSPTESITLKEYLARNKTIVSYKVFGGARYGRRKGTVTGE